MLNLDVYSISGGSKGG